MKRSRWMCAWVYSSLFIYYYIFLLPSARAMRDTCSHLHIRRRWVGSIQLFFHTIFTFGYASSIWSTHMLAKINKNKTIDRFIQIHRILLTSIVWLTIVHSNVQQFHRANFDQSLWYPTWTFSMIELIHWIKIVFGNWLWVISCADRMGDKIHDGWM